MSPTTKATRLASIKFLTADELQRLFSVIAAKRDRALFLLAYRHGLRAVATHLFDAGADIPFVQDWLGHSNIQNTVIYTYLSSATRAEKARGFFRKLVHL